MVINGKEYEPNHTEYMRVCEELRRDHVQLNMVHIHRIFGQPFFELMLLALTSSADARSEFDLIFNPSRQCGCKFKDRPKNTEMREWLKDCMCMNHWTQTDYYRNKLVKDLDSLERD